MTQLPGRQIRKLTACGIDPIKQILQRIAADQFVGIQATLIAPATVILMVGIAVFEDVTPTALNILLSVIACSTKAGKLLRLFFQRMEHDSVQ